MDLYTIVDHSQVWINAEIYQSEIGFVSVGQRAVATTNAYPGREFVGRVSYVFPHMEHETRTLTIRTEFPNPDLELKPEMYTNVELKIPLGRRLVVPESALVDTGTRQIVFVVQAPGNYLPRDVRTGVRVDGSVEILQGLRAGEEVVTSANFLIDSESQLRAALGSMAMATGVTEMAGRPTTTPAGGAPTAPQAQIQFRSAPTPPRMRGTNLFVTLTDTAGSPISDAAVRVVFFMPSMPAMGMAAIREEAQLNPSGGGVYQGQIRLQSPGTWQVTITAERGGTLLGTQQLSVTAQP
jgi:Cu(I)/Ag(I) efflux system membrane fusion protein/cobalt-zinc-cadmium efflux system membrane fusion protein